MTDKQFYVKVSFEFGVDDGGTYIPKNTGEAAWVSMPQVDVVALQNHAIIPSMNMMNTRAGELGLAAAGISMPDLSDLGGDESLTPGKSAGNSLAR